MSNEIILPHPEGKPWYIAYKVGNGRSIAHPATFATQELAQRKLDAMGRDVAPPCDFNETMHVVKTGA